MRVKIKMDVEVNSLSELRKAHGFTQVELAKKLEITQAYLCFLEKKKGKPSLELLNKLLEIFDIKYEQISSFIKK